MVEDCCKHEHEKGHKSSGSMADKKTMLWVVIAVLAVVTVFVTVKTMNLGAATQTITAAASSGGAMVGGC